MFSWAGEIMPKYISSDGFVWLRIVTAAILFNLTALFFVREKADWKADWRLFIICAFFGTAANMYMFFKGLSLTYPINGAVLMMVTPLFVAILDHFRHRRMPGLHTVFGLMAGTAGAVLLIAGKGVHFTAKTLEGDIWVAVNALFYAIYLILVKPLAVKYHAVTVNRITFAIGILIIAPFGAAELFRTDFTAIPSDIGVKILYTLFFTSFLVYLLNTYGMKHASAELVGVYIYLQPLLATVIALLTGRDELTFAKTLYGAMILIGVWLVSGKYRLSFSPFWKKGV
ncbi:MAG: EamA family transporter [Bacteroidetes bacterium]|nr:EamA family transporter [Bacteroidota bacterium]